MIEMSAYILSLLIPKAAVDLAGWMDWLATPWTWFLGQHWVVMIFVSIVALVGLYACMRIFYKTVESFMEMFQ
jgi:uncharacterized membrane protein